MGSFYRGRRLHSRPGSNSALSAWSPGSELQPSLGRRVSSCLTCTDPVLGLRRQKGLRAGHPKLGLRHLLHKVLEAS